jgi:predicted kinase
MDILELARKSGMTVVLDAKIGRQEYRTVHGSVAALERFAEILTASMHDEPVAED